MAAKRLPLLEELSHQKRLASGVLERVLGSITRDLDAVEQNALAYRYKPPESPEIAAEVAAALARLIPTRSASPTPLAALESWRPIPEACQKVYALREHTERHHLAPELIDEPDRRLSAARDAASQLALEGKLAFPTLRLIHAELDRLRQVVDGRRFSAKPWPTFDSDEYAAPVRSMRYLVWAIPRTMPRAKDLDPELLKFLQASFEDALKDLTDRKLFGHDRLGRFEASEGLVARTQTALRKLKALVKRSR